MIRRKSKAIISTSDGAGGMTQVVDHRFQTGDWPIRFSVPMPGADTWLQYLSSACIKKGWGRNGIGQLGPKENSASLTITKGPEEAQLAIAWERKRGRSLDVKARSVGILDFPLSEARAFLDEVTASCRSQVKERFYLRGQLEYEGSAWIGELWLDDSTRLSKPSQNGDLTAIYLPRIILVDGEVESIDQFDAHEAMSVKLRELAIFLTVILGHDVQVPQNGRRAWTWSPAGDTNSEIRELGYLERAPSQGMPARGQDEPISLRNVTRPDLSILSHAIDWEYIGEKPPSDIVDLWQLFVSLSAELRRQFLAVGALWRLAISLRGDNATVGYALMTAACEALKPRGAKFRDRNFYDVTEALFGTAIVEQLKSFQFPPVDVRNALLHGGEFKGSEFVHEFMMSSFSDPSFSMASMGPPAGNPGPRYRMATAQWRPGHA